MIDVSNLSKAYGDVQALKDVSFGIASGEIVGLLGPNGAGKTTIIKIITGYLQPDEGTVLINDLDVLEHTREVPVLALARVVEQPEQLLLDIGRRGGHAGHHERSNTT